MTSVRIGILGCGRIGGAIVGGLTKSGEFSSENLCGSVRREESIPRVKELGIRVTTDNKELVQQSDVVVLTVEPHHLMEALHSIRGVLPPETLLISAVAGRTIAEVSAASGHECVVRIMPNTPIEIGMSVTGWIASSAVSEAQCEVALRMIKSVSLYTYLVSNEEDLNKVTALSGCGPAWVFQFVKWMKDAGVHIGIPHDDSFEMTLATIEGSIALMRHRMKTAEHKACAHPDYLTDCVRTPGGATSEGLVASVTHGFGSSIIRMITAAYEKINRLSAR